MVDRGYPVSFSRDGGSNYNHSRRLGQSLLSVSRVDRRRTSEGIGVSLDQSDSLRFFHGLSDPSCSCERPSSNRRQPFRPFRRLDGTSADRGHAPALGENYQIPPPAEVG